MPRWSLIDDRSHPWDASSNLVSTESDGVTTIYAYDAGGQRVAQATVASGATTGTATAYVASGEVTDPDTSSSAANNLSATRFYTFGGATVAVRSGAGGFWLLFGDEQGSAQLMMPATIGAGGALAAATQADADAVQRTAYDPYGARRGVEDLEINRGWLGQTEDAGTGLTYLNARYYDSAIGRFLSPDPLMDPGDPKTLDPYMYAANNPVTFIDATGLCYALKGDWEAMAQCGAASTVAHKVLEHAKQVAKAKLDAKKYPALAGVPGTLSHGLLSQAPIRANATSLNVIQYNVLRGTIDAQYYNSQKMGWGDIIEGTISGTFYTYFMQDIDQCINGGNLGSCGMAALGLIPGVGKLGSVRHLDDLGDIGHTADSAFDGYSSFDRAKTALGSPGAGNVYDHVVEQSQIARSGFSPNTIHSPGNLNAVSARVNQLKANYYSTKPDWADGGTVRDWLSGQSFADQHAFGVKITRDILDGKIGGVG